MSSQIVIDGQWYEVGILLDAEAMTGKPYLEKGGACMHTCGGDTEFAGRRHSLTPIDTPAEWRVGTDALKAVPEELHSRAIGCHSPIAHEHYVHQGRAYQAGGTHQCDDLCVILSPPPEPPKGAEELLADIVHARENLKLLSGDQTLADAIDAAEEHVAAQE